MSASAFDIEILAKTIYGEARGSNMPGKIAVASVIINRFKRPGWWTRHPDNVLDDTIAAVCLDPKQFSCWNDGDPNLRKIALLQGDSAVLQECTFAALGVILGHFTDPTGGSCHYAVVGTNPSWAEGHVPVCTLGKHEFWNDIE